MESEKTGDFSLAGELLESLLPHTGNSIRIGITGVPGVGKSTFIESLGLYLAESGKKVAVLAVDPTSQVSKGSILGDKTRMEKLSQHKNAFIRPSPAGDSLGGVGAKTREAMLLCEAAGYDVLLVETVGVGQSETVVHSMVDFFVLLMLSGAGDELQGIKRGIMEMADLVLINKADGSNIKPAKVARSEYMSALHLFPAGDSFWHTKVETCSSLDNVGISETWNLILEFQSEASENGFLNALRRRQAGEWFDIAVRAGSYALFSSQTNVEGRQVEYRESVVNGKMSALNAARKLLLGE